MEFRAPTGVPARWESQAPRARPAPRYVHDGPRAVAWALMHCTGSACPAVSMVAIAGRRGLTMLNLQGADGPTGKQGPVGQPGPRGPQGSPGKQGAFSSGQRACSRRG